MRSFLPRCLVLLAVFAAIGPALASTEPVTFETHYRAEVRPAQKSMHVEIKLSGQMLPRKLTFTIDPQRHRSFTDRQDRDRRQDRHLVPAWALFAIELRFHDRP